MKEFDQNILIKRCDLCHFDICTEKIRYRPMKSMCNTSILLTILVLRVFHHRFSLCFLSLWQLILGLCYCSPETVGDTRSHPGGSKPSNKLPSAPSKEASNVTLHSTENATLSFQDQKQLDRSVSSLSTSATYSEESESKTIPSSNYIESDGVRDFKNSTASKLPEKRDLNVKKVSAQGNGSAGFPNPVTKTCGLHLVADHLFFQQVGKADLVTTVTIMREVIQGVDSNFRATDFDQDGVGDNLGFLIQNITVLQNSSSTPPIVFPYTANATTDPVDYLKTFSTMDHTSYCLAVAFTNLKFQPGLRAISWTASSSFNDLPGGICERRRRRRVSGNQDSGEAYSFNTAAITFANGQGQRLSREVAVRVLTHELGHSFGSFREEQNSSACGYNSSVPDTPTTNQRPHAHPHPRSTHYRFSPCDIRQMLPVIAHKGSCLQPLHSHTRCGNGLLEPGEECDCGPANICHLLDPCCSPSEGSRRSTDPPCTVRRSQGYVCSPASQSCCFTDCHASSVSVTCVEENECHERSVCDGQNGACPRPVAKPDGSLCGGGARYCVGGECVSSVCRRYGLEPCQCPSPEENQCQLCCRSTEHSQCLPAQHHNITDEQGLPIYLFPGDPCSDVSSLDLCDEDNKCVSYFRLKSAFYSKILEETPARWFIKYWPYILIFLVLIILTVVFKLSKQHLDNAHVQSLQYGRILGILKITHCVGTQNIHNVGVTRYVFDRFLKKAARGRLSMSCTEAVSRLRVFLPTCPLSQIMTTVSMASTEDVAVRVLLAQGYPSRRFMPKLTESQFAHLAHLLPRMGMSFWERSTTKEDIATDVNDKMSLSDSFSFVLSSQLSRNVSTVGSIESSVLEESSSQIDKFVKKRMTRIKATPPGFYSMYMKHFQAHLEQAIEEGSLFDEQEQAVPATQPFWKTAHIIESPSLPATAFHVKSDVEEEKTEQEEIPRKRSPKQEDDGITGVEISQTYSMQQDTLHVQASDLLTSLYRRFSSTGPAEAKTTVDTEPKARRISQEPRPSKHVADDDSDVHGSWIEMQMSKMARTRKKSLPPFSKGPYVPQTRKSVEWSRIEAAPNLKQLTPTTLKMLDKDTPVEPTASDLKSDESFTGISLKSTDYCTRQGFKSAGAYLGSSPVDPPFKGIDSMRPLPSRPTTRIAAGGKGGPAGFLKTHKESAQQHYGMDFVDVHMDSTPEMKMPRHNTRPGMGDKKVEKIQRKSVFSSFVNAP